MTKKPEILTKTEVEGLVTKRPRFPTLGRGKARAFKEHRDSHGLMTTLPDAPTPAGLKAMLMRHFRGLRTVVFFQDHMKPIVCCILIFKPACWWSLGIYQAWVKRKASVLLRKQLAVGSKLAGVWW
jgi:hypothetical protein